MIAIPASSLAALVRLTDPTERAMREARTALDELSSAIVALTSAANEEGEVSTDWLLCLLIGAEDALEVLERAVSP
jgi:hypothetical protein